MVAAPIVRTPLHRGEEVPISNKSERLSDSVFPRETCRKVTDPLVHEALEQRLRDRTLMKYEVGSRG